MFFTRLFTLRMQPASQLLGVLWLGVLVAFSPRLAAHPMPSSLVQPDIEASGVGDGLHIALNQLVTHKTLVAIRQDWNAKLAATLPGQALPYVP